MATILRGLSIYEPYIPFHNAEVKKPNIHRLVLDLDSLPQITSWITDITHITPPSKQAISYLVIAISTDDFQIRHINISADWIHSQSSAGAKKTPRSISPLAFVVIETTRMNHVEIYD